MILTGQSEVGRLDEVLLKHAREAFVGQERIAGEWRELGYHAPPEFSRAVAEFDAFAAVLEQAGARLRWLPRAEGAGLDSIYVRDGAIATDAGLILCGMGKAARRGEPQVLERDLAAQGLAVLGRLTGDARLEGGDLVWLDRRTPAIGLGYRTNLEGIARLRELLGPTIDEPIVVPLPHWRGPADVMHLMSLLSPLDDDLALVYAPLLPVPFRQRLLDRGVRLVEVPDEEFDTLGGNVLALAPRRCVMLEGNPVTRRRLEAAGVDVRLYAGREISLKGSGGPTCLTRPLAREVRAD